MAGQPQDPSFQPPGHEQDQGLTKGRPAWQPGYSEPASPPPPAGGGPGTGGGRAYAAPPPAYAQEQGYGAGPDQTFVGQPDHGYGGQEQAQAASGYSGGYQQPGPGRAAGTAPPGWHTGTGTATGTGTGSAAQQGSRSSEHHEKGFLGSLFDFSFSSFVTPKIIRALYILFTLWTALVALIITIIGFRTGGAAGGLFTLIVIVPVFVLLTLGVYRVVLEAFMVVFRIYEETKRLRENSDRDS